MMESESARVNETLMFELLKFEVLLKLGSIVGLLLTVCCYIIFCISNLVVKVLLQPVISVFWPLP